MVPKRIAVVGGDRRSERVAWPAHYEVTCYQSSKFGGEGQLKRLRNALRAGKYDIVVVLSQWMGYPMSNTIRREAPCRVLVWRRGLGALVDNLDRELAAVE